MTTDDTARDAPAINHALWQTTAALQREQGFARVRARVVAADFNPFDTTERALWATLQPTGKRVLQLGCNDGQEAIGLTRLGARVTGVDFSEGFIEQAQELAAAAGVEATFVCCDFAALPAQRLGRFEVVYVSVGVLGWLPDVRAFFAIAAAHLDTGGALFVYEQHPLLNGFNPEPPHVRDADYFRREPFHDTAVPEYVDTERAHQAPSLWFPHTLSEVLGGVLDAGLRLTHFAEYPHDVSDTYRALEGQRPALPLSFSLIARHEPPR